MALKQLRENLRFKKQLGSRGITVQNPEEIRQLMSEFVMKNWKKEELATRLIKCGLVDNLKQAKTTMKQMSRGNGLVIDSAKGPKTDSIKLHLYPQGRGRYMVGQSLLSVHGYKVLKFPKKEK